MNTRMLHAIDNNTLQKATARLRITAMFQIVLVLLLFFDQLMTADPSLFCPWLFRIMCTSFLYSECTVSAWCFVLCRCTFHFAVTDLWSVVNICAPGCLCCHKGCVQVEIGVTVRSEFWHSVVIYGNAAVVCD